MKVNKKIVQIHLIFTLKPKKRNQYWQGQYAMTLKLANLLKGKLQLIPAQKLCRECWKKVTTMSISLSSPQHFSSLSENENSSASLSSCEDNTISCLDNSLIACGVSPFKSSGKSKQQKLNHANKKMEKMAKKFGNCICVKRYRSHY